MVSLASPRGMEQGGLLPACTLVCSARVSLVFMGLKSQILSPAGVAQRLNGLIVDL